MGCWIDSVFTDEVIFNEGAKLWKASYEIADGEVTLGTRQEVEREVSFKPVFSFSEAVLGFGDSDPDDSEMVLRTGKLFEAGHFPDKGVSFDDADLEAAAREFSPVPNDLEHRPSVLDGKLGKLQKVWKQGSELYGTVALPKWLDKMVGGQAKVSLAFNGQKRIVGNGIVLRPRIADAAVFAAFSAYEQGQTPAPGTKEPKRNTTMKLKEAIKHLFGLDSVDPEAEVNLPASGSPAPGPETPATPATPAAAATTETPAGETPVFSAQLEALKAQNAALAQQAVGAAAYAFADGLIREKKALPAQREQIAGMFRGAVNADAKDGVFFNADSTVIEGSQVKALKAYFEAAPVHAFSGEALPSDTMVVFAGGGGGGNAGMDAEKKAALLAKTGLGQKAAKEAGK